MKKTLQKIKIFSLTCHKFRGQATAHRLLGFTLIELTIVIVLLSIFSMTLMYLLQAANNSYTTSKSTLKKNAEISMLIHRLRADFIASMPKSFTTKTATQCSFSNSNGRVISYVFNAGVLTRQDVTAGTSAYPLANQLASSGGIFFNYLKNDGLTVASLATDINYVSVTITPINNNPITLWIDLRNAK